MKSEWEKFVLADIINIIGGGTPKRAIPEYWNGNIPWLSVVDFNTDNRHVFEAKESITELGLQKSSTKLLEAGQIIISARGTVGALAQLYKPMAFNQSCYGLDGKQELITNDFLYYLVKEKIKDLQQITHGGVFDTITKDTFKQIEISLPPLQTQKKIAHILSTLDDKIELNRKMNQTLEEMASAIFKSWFVDFDPVHAKANREDEAELENIAKELGISKAILDLFPSEFIESELGMIPKGWKIINFKDLVEKYIDNRGKTPPLVENGIPLLEVRTLPNEMLSSEYLTDKCVSDEIYNTWFRSHLETDDILISTVGTIGLTSIVPPNSKFVIAQNVLGIRANEEFILKKFMFYLMKSKFFIDAINARLVTTVQSSIKRKDMETINIIIPDFSTQKEFVKIVTPIMEKMQSNEILNLEKNRDTLLPKLLSGEIDVSKLEIK